MTAVAQMQEVMERLRGPETPPAEVAGLLAEVWGDEGVPPGLLLGNTIPGGRDRLAEIAGAAGKLAPGSVLSRVLAAELRGVVEQDREGGLRLLDELLPGLPMPARINVAWRTIALGAPARAAGIAREVLMAVAGWDAGDGSQPGGDLDPEQREGAASAAERLLAAAVHAAGEQAAADDGHSDEVSLAEAFRDPAVLRSLEAGFARWLARTPQAAPVVADQVTELHEVLPEDAPRSSRWSGPSRWPGAMRSCSEAMKRTARKPAQMTTAEHWCAGSPPTLRSPLPRPRRPGGGRTPSTSGSGSWTNRRQNRAAATSSIW